MNNILQEIWDSVPAPLKKADYCFYVGKGYTSVPKKFKNKKVIVVYIIDDFKIYYAPNTLLYQLKK